MATLVLMPAMSNYGDTIHFSGSSSLGSYTVRQQNLMAIGSSIPVFTHNPHLVFLFLPYLFLANLFLPLGIGARNFIGAISSVENAVLLWWVVFSIRNRYVWKILNQKLHIVKLFFIYF